ncbi:MAG: hypothetical protein MHPSP_001049, partial [Paramarteilia canceri]
MDGSPTGQKQRTNLVQDNYQPLMQSDHQDVAHSSVLPSDYQLQPDFKKNINPSSMTISPATPGAIPGPMIRYNQQMNSYGMPAISTSN